MEAFLGNISARQAKEWELFSIENPLFEDKVMVQFGMIAQLFASYFIKRKDGKNWEVIDFIPDFSKKSEEKDDVKVFSKNIMRALGVSKSKDKEKRVKYSLEDKVGVRKTLPRRLRGVTE